jgi:uncharacterized protein YkwD
MKKDTIETISGSSLVFFLIAALQIGLGIFYDPQRILDGILYAVLAFFLYKFKSRAAAILLFLFSLAVFVLTTMNRLTGNNSGSGNVVLAVFVVIASIKAIQATFEYHKEAKTKNKKEGVKKTSKKKAEKIVKISSLVVGVSVLLVILVSMILVAYGIYTSVAKPSNTEVALPPATPEELLVEVNRKRAEVGAAPLIIDPRLNQSAQIKANDMLTNGYYSHDNPTTKKHGYEYIQEFTNTGCHNSSENITGAYDSENAKAIIDWWSESEDHYKAIVDPRYKTTGFGVITVDNKRPEYEGSRVYVEHFCEPF